MKKQLLSIITGAVLLGSVNASNAQSGTALNFDGVNDAVVLGNSINAVLDPLNTITVEAWVKPSLLTSYRVIAGNYNTDINNSQMQFLVRQQNDQYTFWVDDGTGWKNVSSGPGVAKLNKWQHIACTWNGSELKIYVNGELRGTTTGVTGSSFATTSNNVKIGYNSINENFIGSIDDVRIWTVARSLTDIKAAMNCPIDPGSTGLLAYYNFDEGVSEGNNSEITTVNDLTENNHNGTLMDFALTGSTSNFVADATRNKLSLLSSIGSTSDVDRLKNGVAADFNGDGLNDLLVSDDNSSIRLYFNEGQGNFSTFTQISPSFGGRYSTGDIDGDGDIDFSVAYNQANVKVYINDGDGAFTPITLTMNGSGTSGITKLVDLNKDGLLDLIIGNNSFGSTDNNEVWLNTGTVGDAEFTFAAALTNNTFGPRTTITTGDVDGDGDIDILTGGYSYYPSIFLNNNNGTFTQRTLPTVYSSQMELADWDLDGDLDVMIYDSYNNVGLKIIKNDGAGNFTIDPNPIAQSSSTNTVKLIDLNGDGLLDAVFDNWGGKGKIYLNTGCALELQTSCEYNLGYSDHGNVVADFNADGALDIFNLGRNNLSTLYINYLSPATTPALPDITSAPDVAGCQGTNSILSATAAGSETIKWYDTPINGSVLATGTTYTVSRPVGNYTYYVDAVNSNGCTLPARIEVDLTVNPKPVISATSGNVKVCGDATAKFGIVSAGTNDYQWFYGNSITPFDSSDIDGSWGTLGFNSDTLIIPQLLSNGWNEYFVYVRVTNQYNCVAYSANDTIWVNPMPDVSTTVNEGIISATETDASYKWLNCNNSYSIIPGQTNQNFSGAFSGSFSVEVTKNGCVDTSACVTITSIGVNSNNNHGIVIYPNPGKDKINIDGAANSLISIINSLGEKVMEVKSDGHSSQIDISALSKGVYVINVKTGTGTSAQRMIIE
ncbi:MAG: FG-GAP-like repeat-containing protein [Cytophagaceae bacterium]